MVNGGQSFHFTLKCTDLFGRVATNQLNGGSANRFTHEQFIGSVNIAKATLTNKLQNSVGVIDYVIDQ